MTTLRFSDGGQVGRCEATVGYDHSGSAPRVLTCVRQGNLRNASIRPFGVILCDEHFDAYENRVKGLRKIN